MVADVVRVDRKTTLQVEMLNIEDIKKVIWTKYSNLNTTSKLNTTIAPETYVILVTSVYTEEGQTPNITYWIEGDYKMTTHYGLVIKQFLPDDQGVYCCKILTFNNDDYEHCATLKVRGKMFIFYFLFSSFIDIYCLFYLFILFN